MTTTSLVDFEELSDVNNETTDRRRLIIAVPSIDQQYCGVASYNEYISIYMFEIKHDNCCDTVVMQGGGDCQSLSSISFNNAMPVNLDVLAICYATAAGRDRAFAFKRILDEFGGAYKNTPAVQFSDVYSLDQIIIKCFGERLYESRMRNSRLALQMASVRRDYERQIENFVALEDFVICRGIKLIDREFSYPVSKKINSKRINWDLFRQDDGTFELRQRLPLSSRGLAMIELPVQQTNIGDSSITIELWTIENQENVGCWIIEGKNIDREMLHLILHRALDGMPLTAELRIKSGILTIPTMLKLGNPHPVPEFCLMYNNSSALQAPLAFNLWKGVPGLKVPRLFENSIVSGVSSMMSDESQCGTVALERLRDIERISDLPTGDTFEPVSFWEEQSAALVHPIDSGVVVARLPNAINGPVKRISIAVELANEQAQPAEVAAAWLPKTVDAIKVFHSEHFDNNYYGSGWVFLSALDHAWLTITVPSREGETGELFIASRGVIGSNCDNSWLLVRRIDFC